MEAALSILGAAAVKATLILAFAGLLTAFWRTASASARHLVWTIAVASALILPLAAVGMAKLGTPRLAVPLRMPVATITADIAPDLPDPVVIDESAKAIGEPVMPAADEGSVSEGIASPVTAQIELPALAAIVASSVGGGVLSDWRRYAMILWAAGAIVALLPLLIAVLRVRILARHARVVTDSSWTYLIERTPAVSHLSSRVRILESQDMAMPMTWGVTHPTLLLPSGARTWPEWKRRNILLHELAHIERRDCLTQLVAEAACAVYWFNPLAWVAAHRMRVERELACDDCVISAGAPASDYAQNLLEVARSLRAPALTSSTAIAMARPSQLSGRLLAVLDARRNRQGVTRSVFAGASFIAAIAVVVLASLTTRAVTAAAAEAPIFAAPGEIVSPPLAAPSAKHLPMPISIVHATQIPAVGLTAAVGPASANGALSARPLAIPGAPTLGVLTRLPGMAQSCWEGSDSKANTSITSNSTDSRESWTVRYTRDDCSLEIKSQGKFELRADLSDLESISSDGWFRVEEREGRNSRRVEIRRGAGGTLEHAYWVNGNRVAWGDAGRGWLASTLLRVERRTAFAASTRVPQLYRTGGLRGVLSEISQMDSDYPKSKYYGTLLEMDVPLDGNTLNDVVGRAANDLKSSDYYLSQVLGKLAAHRSANEGTWRAFTQASSGMKSDYYKSQSLKKVLNSGKLGTDDVGVLLNAAAGIESDYYLSDLLKSVAARYALNEATTNIYAEAMSSIESDHYRMQVLTTMNSADRWDPRTTSFVLASIRKMDSDHYKSQSLISLVKNKHVSDWNAFFAAAGTIGSGTYRRQTLNAALQHDPLTRDIVAGVIAQVPRMESDYEASQVLVTVARSYKLDGDLREAYEKATDSIESEHYRGSALVALRRNASN
jgi:beta-lactamase regulating signal transducer with metallopeptidase domain